MSVRPSVLFVRRLIVSADLGALTWWPWPGGLGLKALGLKALGVKALGRCPKSALDTPSLKKRVVA